MPKRTINNLWAQNSANRLTFTNDDVGLGIQYKAAVISSQLNGVAYDLYEYVDNLQRAGTSWNPLKEYSMNDCVKVKLTYNGLAASVSFAAIGTTSTPPLVNAGANKFLSNYDGNICEFIITDDGTKALEDYVSPQWRIMPDYSIVESRVAADKVKQDLDKEVVRATNRENQIESLIADIREYQQRAVPQTLHAIYEELNAKGGQFLLKAGFVITFTLINKLNDRNEPTAESFAYTYFIGIVEPLTIDLNTELFECGAQKYTLQNFKNRNFIINEYAEEIKCLGLGTNSSVGYNFGNVGGSYKDIEPEDDKGNII